MDIDREMRIETVIVDDERIAIQTTGARYVFIKTGDKGRVLCYQRLNRERLVATLSLQYPLPTLTVEHSDDGGVVLHQHVGDTWYVKLCVNRDSVLDIYSMHPLELQLTGDFTPAYVAQREANMLLADEVGGLGVYPCRGYHLAEAVDTSGSNWRLQYQGERFCRVLISVFPPRRFQHERSFDERIAHFGVNPPWTFGTGPSDAQIEAAAQYANILVLHCQIWSGKLTRQGLAVKSVEDALAESSYCSYAYEPVDEDDLRRIVDHSHALGLRVIPYFSPTFSMSAGATFRQMVADVVERYGFDGVYYDGVTFDLLEGYELMRATREMLGDRLIYLHTTWEPLHSRNVPCPFIDTYADFVLRGEHPADFQDDKYLRYVLAGFNVSNAIGFVCTCYYPADFVRNIIDQTLSFNGRFYLALPETETEAVLVAEYLPKLDERARAYRAGKS